MSDAPASPSLGPERGIVLRGTGGIWHVRTESGVDREAMLAGRLKQEKKLDPANKLAVGDRVTIELGERGAGWVISEIHERTSRLARRSPGAKQSERVVVANVDQVVVVFALVKPEPHPRMLDRFLVIAEANELSALIIINKVELVGEDTARERFADYERAGYQVHFTSVKQRIGLDAVEQALAGKTSVVSGPSGVGKSSLLNALFPGLGLRVSEVSESVNKGMHTTVGAYLHPLPASVGGAVVDTPGLREIGMWELPVDELVLCFPELRTLRDACKFRNCSHIREPGCAIRAAVEKQAVSRARYESYLKLRSEIEAEETN